MFCFITLWLYKNRVKYSYDVTFLCGRMTGIIMQNCVVIGVCDEVMVQKFSTCLKIVI